MKAFGRTVILTTIIIAGSHPLSAQAFFSINAGTDGFILNLTNAYPVYAPPVVVAPVHHRHHHHEAVCVPLLPGLEYPVVSHKEYRKAVKRYRKATRHGMAGGAISFPGGGIMVSLPVGGYHYDYDDDYDEWVEDRYKHHKKMYKKYKKARKHRHHHKHHH